MSARTAPGEHWVNEAVNRATERCRSAKGSASRRHGTSGPTAAPPGTRGPHDRAVQFLRRLRRASGHAGSALRPSTGGAALLLAATCAGMHPVSRSASTTRMSVEASLQVRDQQRCVQHHARGRVPRNWVHSCTPKRDSDSGPRSRRVRIRHLDPTGPLWTSEAAIQPAVGQDARLHPGRDTPAGTRLPHTPQNRLSVAYPWPSPSPRRHPAPGGRVDGVPHRPHRPPRGGTRLRDCARGAWPGGGVAPGPADPW